MRSIVREARRACGVREARRACALVFIALGSTVLTCECHSRRKCLKQVSPCSTVGSLHGLSMYSSVLRKKCSAIMALQELQERRLWVISMYTNE